jgi:hypothetical protein
MRAAGHRHAHRRRGKVEEHEPVSFYSKQSLGRRPASRAPFVLWGVVALALGLLSPSIAEASAETSDSTGAMAVPTYESIGLYWRPAAGSTTNTAHVEYREVGTASWMKAMPLSYSTASLGGRSPEYRGSILNLAAETAYEIKMTLASGSTTTLQSATWADPESLPIARTVVIPPGSEYEIREGGTPAGYVLYTMARGTKLDDPTHTKNVLRVYASHVIIRGVTITGGLNSSWLAQSGLHHVVYDRNDFSGWGPTCPEPLGSQGCGRNNSAITGGANTNVFRQITIQRNRLHDPNSVSNSWCESGNGSTHPWGPRGVYLPRYTENSVIRYNEITSSLEHTFEDGMGSNYNFTDNGFPNADSDINGNVVTHVADDAIEVEGANRNVRVWGNYIDATYTGIAHAATSVGPLYVFRNVMDRSSKCPRQEGGAGWASSVSDSGSFGKYDDTEPTYNGGRRYILHNTLLQRTGARGANSGLHAVGANTTAEPLRNAVVHNNLWNATGEAYRFDVLSDGSVVDYDLSSSGARFGTHSLAGRPAFAAGHGNDAGRSGLYQLAVGSLGHDQGRVLPTINDGYTGTAPDMGAHETDTSRMQFGILAYASSETTPQAPSAPRIGTPTAADGVARARWSAPVSSGGSPVTEYVVKAYRNWTMVATATVPATASDHLFRGLTNGAHYSFVVQARNVLGTSVHSARSSTVTPMGRPDAPRIGRPSSANDAARVYWAAPVDDGGSTISAYVVRAYQGTRGIKAVTVSGSARSVLITGLQHGAYYTFTVTAKNHLGFGPASPRSATVRTT